MQIFPTLAITTRQRIIFPILILTFFVTVRGTAQHSAPPIEGPPIVPAPANVSYLLTMNARGEGENAREAQKQPAPADIWANTIVQWQIVRTGAVTAIATTDKNGQKGEMWIAGGNEIVRPPGSSTFFIHHASAAGGDPYHLDFGRYGYPFTSWISLSNFVKKTTLQGKPALRFASKRTENGGADDLTPGSQPTAVTVGVAAWIDFETRQPLCVSDTENTYTFKFLPPPTSPLVLPPAVQTLLDQQERRTRETSAIPSPP